MSGIWAPYLTQVALTGTDQPELREWNFKAVTNYTFVSGPLNGVNIGGGYRWASKPVLGYPSLRSVSQDVFAERPRCATDMRWLIHLGLH